MRRLFRKPGRTCPLCGSKERDRTRRPRKWKLLFLGRAYACRACSSQYIEIFRVFSLLVERGFESFYIPASKFDASAHTGE